MIVFICVIIYAIGAGACCGGGRNSKGSRVEPAMTGVGGGVKGNGNSTINGDVNGNINTKTCEKGRNLGKKGSYGLFGRLGIGGNEGLFWRL
ncbi:hypothetical protein R80B4_02573 [Fibrobacteres bacterium R8-0-B4]